MTSFIDDLVQATKRYGVPVVVIGGDSYIDDADLDDVVPSSVAVEDPEGDESELQQLRSQVQQLTHALQQKEQELVSMSSSVTVTGNGNGQVPAGDHGFEDDQSIQNLGFEDEALLKKLMRLGHDTVGKLRTAHLEGTLAEQKIKKDWLIEVGMRLCRALPSGRAPATHPAGGGSVGGDGTVPSGHAVPTWEEKLNVARVKEQDLQARQVELDKKRAEGQKYLDKGKEIPETLDEEVLEMEDEIIYIQKQLIAMRWCLGLDPADGITLDDALERANLGPWKTAPTPRLAP